MATYHFDKDLGKVVKKEDEHPSYISFLNPHIRSHSHGQHRRTSPKAHRDPSDGAGAGARGAYTLRTTIPTGRTYGTSPGSLAPSPSTFALSGGGASLTRQAMYDAMHRMIQQSFYDFDLARLEPKPPTLPYAGIRTGEIIGHRAWWVLPDGLYSLAHMFRWVPGATIKGNLEEIVEQSLLGTHVIWGGVYAYALPNAQLKEECKVGADWLTNPARCAMQHSTHPGIKAIGLVRGTVKLWGEVIEHELGWRAQYAKLASIEEVWGDSVRVSEVLESYRASL